MASADDPLPMTFTCPQCEAVSHHPKDEQHGYCGRCHTFTGLPMTDPVLFAEGDAITISAEGRTLQGRIIMASPNGKSLVIGFDAMIGGYVGMMPVSHEDGDRYRDLINDHEILIARRTY